MTKVKKRKHRPPCSRPVPKPRSRSSSASCDDLSRMTKAHILINICCVKDGRIQASVIKNRTGNVGNINLKEDITRGGYTIAITNGEIS